MIWNLSASGCWILRRVLRDTYSPGGENIFRRGGTSPRHETAFSDTPWDLHKVDRMGWCVRREWTIRLEFSWRTRQAHWRCMLPPYVAAHVVESGWEGGGWRE